MFIKTKSFRTTVMLSALLFLTLAAVPAQQETNHRQNNIQVTKFKVNGLSALVFLLDEDDGSQGFVFPTRDEIANTAALDFGFAAPHPSEPNVSIVFQGSGAIPNNAFTINATGAHLSVTTPPSYLLVRCLFNEVTGDLTCDPSPDPITFDLTWSANGVGSTFEKFKRTDIFGALTTKFEAELVTKTAIVSGTWSNYLSAAMSGTLMDSKQKTFIREVTLGLNP